MKFSLALALFMTLNYLCQSQPGIVPKLNTIPPSPESCKGIPGFPGKPGEYGHPGDYGEPGKSASSLSRPPPGTPCMCPTGPKGPDGKKGKRGEPGLPGRMGVDGTPGDKGDAGSLGVPGLPGPRGTSLSPHPPSKSDTMYVPVVIKGRLPPVICHHFKKHSYVPGVPNNWLGWFEAGKSGFSTYNKWVYYSSQFTCPCSIAVPPGPTPSADEMLRRL